MSSPVMLSGEGATSIARFTASNFLVKKLVGVGGESMGHYMRVALASFIDEYGLEGSLDGLFKSMNVSQELRVFLSQTLGTTVALWVVEKAAGNDPEIMGIIREMALTNVVDAIIKKVVPMKL